MTEMYKRKWQIFCGSSGKQTGNDFRLPLIDA